MLFTPSGPSRSMAWPIRSVRPQLSIRKPKSRWNLSVAALESRRLKELKQHSGLTGEQRDELQLCCCDRFVRAPELWDVPSLITPFRERLMSPVYTRQTLNLLYRVCNYALARGKYIRTESECRCLKKHPKEKLAYFYFTVD